MNIPEKAYELAKSAGWSPIVFVGNESMIPHQASWQVHALDPLFFQALGKALGWDRSDKGLCRVTGKWEKLNPAFYADCLPHREATQRWDLAAKDFYDLIHTEGDTEKFWSELLTNTKEE